MERRDEQMHKLALQTVPKQNQFDSVVLMSDNWSHELSKTTVVKIIQNKCVKTVFIEKTV